MNVELKDIEVDVDQQHATISLDEDYSVDLDDLGIDEWIKVCVENDVDYEGSRQIQTWRNEEHFKEENPIETIIQSLLVQKTEDEIIKIGTKINY